MSNNIEKGGDIIFHLLDLAIALMNNEQANDQEAGLSADNRPTRTSVAGK
jgi:hypothetical protein